MTRLPIGSPFPREFPGGTWNRLVELLEEVKPAGGTEPLAGLLAASDPVGMVIHVVNETGEDLHEHAIGIIAKDSFAIDPPEIVEEGEEEEDRADEVIFGGVQVEIVAPKEAPEAPEEGEGNLNDTFVITIDLIPIGEVGRAYLPNAAWARVDIQDAEDSSAGPQDGDTKFLKSGTGSTLILVKPNGTGKKWCIVLLRGGGGGSGRTAGTADNFAICVENIPKAAVPDLTGVSVVDWEFQVGQAGPPADRGSLFGEDGTVFEPYTDTAGVVLCDWAKDWVKTDMSTYADAFYVEPKTKFAPIIEAFGDQAHIGGGLGGVGGDAGRIKYQGGGGGGI